MFFVEQLFKIAILNKVYGPGLPVKGPTDTIHVGIMLDGAVNGYYVNKLSL